MAKVFKTTVNLPEQYVEALKVYARKKGITRTEAIKRAISIQKFIESQVNDGGKIIIEKNGELREIAIL